jgi:hypothetical protein
MGKSTGPRTPGGKVRASRNAAKHWIESGRILPGEQKQAAILRSGLAEYFNPQGMIENELIDDLTMNRLIKRRIDIADTREYSKAAVEKDKKYADHIEHPITQYWIRFAGGRHWLAREHGERLRPDGCIAALQVLKKGIGDNGPQPQDAAALQRIYGDQPTRYAAFLMHELVPVVEKQSVQDGKSETADEKQRKESILDALENEIEIQKIREEFEDRLDDIENASDIQEPPRPALETLLRYRAANTREFNVLLNSLERIRKLRADGT